MDRTWPLSNRGVAFPTLRPPRLGVFSGTGAVDETWKRAALEPVSADGVRDPWASSAVNIAPIKRVEPHPKLIPPATCVKRHQKLTPGDTKTDPLLINGTVPTGLSTLCPRRRSPDNQVAVGNRVGNPIDGLGRWPLPPLATPPAVLCSRWAAIGSPWGTVRSEHRPNQNSRAGVAEVQQKRRRAMIEHRPFQIAEWGFPRFAHRASFFWGSAPWTKRGKRATSGAFPGAGRQPIATAPDWSEHRPNQNPRSSRGGERRRKRLPERTPPVSIAAESPPNRFDTVDIYSIPA